MVVLSYPIFLLFNYNKTKYYATQFYLAPETESAPAARVTWGPSASTALEEVTEVTEVLVVGDSDYELLLQENDEKPSYLDCSRDHDDRYKLQHCDIETCKMYLLTD